MTVKKVVSTKVRQTNNLSRSEKRTLHQLKVDKVKCLNAISYINSGIKKTSLKRGNQSNLGAVGIHSVSTYDTYSKRIDTFLKWSLINYEIKTLGSLKPAMVNSYFDELIQRFEEGDLSAKTIKNYMNGILKLQEGGAKREIHSLSRIVQIFTERLVSIEYKRLSKSWREWGVFVRRSENH
jgi:hypothetical protein